MTQEGRTAADERSGTFAAVRKGLLIGAAALVFLLPPVIIHWRHTHSPPVAAAHGPVQLQSPPVASFGAESPSPEVRELANWVADSRDNGKNSFVIVDKKNARVFVFDPQAHLKSAAPAVLGAAHGDDTAPGIADKPLPQVKFEERTTPAGRFVAEVGESSSRGEDVVWVDYDAAVSMHRVIPAKERLAALETPDPADNRLSYGCINLPKAFYETVLRPAVDQTGAVIYVLPETRGLKDTFAGFYDVSSTRLAQH